MPCPSSALIPIPNTPSVMRYAAMPKLAYRAVAARCPTGPISVPDPVW